MHPAVAWTCVTACTAWNVAGLFALLRVTHAPAPANGPANAVSVLKPLNGADDALYENLASFFTQDHPQFELLFGVTSATDPALATVARLQREHPRVPCRIVVHEGSHALNPKVRNLL